MSGLGGRGGPERLGGGIGGFGPTLRQRPFGGPAEDGRIIRHPGLGGPIGLCPIGAPGFMIPARISLVPKGPSLIGPIGLDPIGLGPIGPPILTRPALIGHPGLIGPHLIGPIGLLRITIRLTAFGLIDLIIIGALLGPPSGHPAPLT